MSLFQFYLYIAGSLYVSGPQAHPQESSHSCSHNTWFSVCTALAVYRHWTKCCVNSCVNSLEDGPVGPKHVEIRQYINKIEIVTSVGFYSICWKDARYKRLKISNTTNRYIELPIYRTTDLWHTQRRLRIMLGTTSWNFTLVTCISIP